MCQLCSSWVWCRMSLSVSRRYHLTSVTLLMDTTPSRVTWRHTWRDFRRQQSYCPLQLFFAREKLSHYTVTVLRHALCLVLGDVTDSGRSFASVWNTCQLHYVLPASVDAYTVDGDRAALVTFCFEATGTCINLLIYSLQMRCIQRILHSFLGNQNTARRCSKYRPKQ